MLAEEDLQRAVEYLDRKFGLDVLWLYGSEAAGTARLDSDVDLGALFQRRPAGLEILEARADLSEILRREVDLVDLDRASPILGMQVLKYGRRVADRNPKHRHAFFSRTVSMYEDLKIQRREIEKALFERMSGARS